MLIFSLSLVLVLALAFVFVFVFVCNHCLLLVGCLVGLVEKEVLIWGPNFGDHFRDTKGNLEVPKGIERGKRKAKTLNISSLLLITMMFTKIVLK